jgi:ML-like domain
VVALQILGLLVHGITGRPVLRNNGLSSCAEDSSYSIYFQKLDFEYYGDDKTFRIDIEGSSDKTQNITAVLSIAAYGNDRYSEELDPCDSLTFIQQLCPGMFPTQ